jgi:hypothetical protein
MKAIRGQVEQLQFRLSDGEGTTALAIDLLSILEEFTLLVRAVKDTEGNNNPLGHKK